MCRQGRRIQLGWLEVIYIDVAEGDSDKQAYKKHKEESEMFLRSKEDVYADVSDLSL